MVFNSKKCRETAILSAEPFWLVSWLGGQNHLPSLHLLSRWVFLSFFAKLLVKLRLTVQFLPASQSQPAENALALNKHLQRNG